MSIQKEEAESWAAEFTESTPFSFLPDEAKEHAAPTLVYFLTKVNELTEDNIRQVMLEKMPELDMPDPARATMPELVQTFLEWHQDSGRTGEGYSLGKFVKALGPAYQERCAPGGGLRILPMVKKTTDIGRNDPCPCGSGAKFKKCCAKR